MNYGLWTASTRTKALLSGLFALVSLAAVIVGVFVVTRASSQPATLILVPVILAAIYYAARVAWRLPRISLTISSDDILIVGPIRTTRVPITEAQQFVAEAKTGAGGQPAIALRRDGADSVGVWVLSQNGFAWNARRIPPACSRSRTS